MDFQQCCKFANVVQIKKAEKAFNALVNTFFLYFLQAAIVCIDHLLLSKLVAARGCFKVDRWMAAKVRPGLLGYAAAAAKCCQMLPNLHHVHCFY